MSPYGCGPSKFGMMPSASNKGYAGFLPGLFPKLRNKKSAQSPDAALAKAASFKPGSSGYNTWMKIATDLTGAGGVSGGYKSPWEVLGSDGGPTVPWGLIGAGAGVILLGSVGVVYMSKKKRNGRKRRRGSRRR